MSYKADFPDYASTIPDVFLAAPWEDASWHNDSCPCFSRRVGPADEDSQVHVYVDEEDPSKRDVWTHADGRQSPLPRYTVRFTDEEGCYHDDEPRDFSTDSLADVIDRIGFIVGEVSR